MDFESKSLALIPQEFWILVGDVYWLALLVISLDGTWLGITRGGEWAVRTSKGVSAIGNNFSFMVLLPLLEDTRSSFVSKLRDSLKTHGLSVALSERFPIDDLIKYALETASAYWKGYAIEWLDKENFSREYQSILCRLVENHEWPQDLRHRIMRLLSTSKGRGK